MKKDTRLTHLASRTLVAGFISMGMAAATAEETTTVVTGGDELKLVFPQDNAMPKRFEHLDFDHFFLQPMDGPEIRKNTSLTIEYCKEHPRWRLSLQTHKYIGID